MADRRWFQAAIRVFLALAVFSFVPARAQEPEGAANQETAAAPDTTLDTTPGFPDGSTAPAAPDDRISFLSLLFQGGIFMIPILILSLLGVTFAIERAFALRRSRVLPGDLIRGLGQLGSASGGFDPKRAYKLCQQYPSAAANVLRSLLSKVGRPHSELQHTVQEASQREAERLYANVRWLNLAAAVAPLLGLLGTVWGMIVAFHRMTMLAPGQNKAEFLAEGIYVALVTTLGGLMVAIPAAILAHYYEGRIQTLFHQVDELIFNLMPQLERFEGRVRFSRPNDTETSANDVVDAPPPPVSGRSAAAK